MARTKATAKKQTAATPPPSTSHVTAIKGLSAPQKRQVIRDAARRHLEARTRFQGGFACRMSVTRGNFFDDNFVEREVQVHLEMQGSQALVGLLDTLWAKKYGEDADETYDLPESLEWLEDKLAAALPEGWRIGGMQEPWEPTSTTLVPAPLSPGEVKLEVTEGLFDEDDEDDYSGELTLVLPYDTISYAPYYAGMMSAVNPLVKSARFGCGQADQAMALAQQKGV